MLSKPGTDPRVESPNTKELANLWSRKKIRKTPPRWSWARNKKGNVGSELAEAGKTGKLVSRAAGDELRSIRADKGGIFPQVRNGFGQ